MVARIAFVLLCVMVFAGTSRAQMPLHKCVTNGVVSYQQIPCQGKAASAPLMGGSRLTAPTAIEGTWKIDRHTIHLPAKSIDLLVQGGKFECKSCDPPCTVNEPAFAGRKAIGLPGHDCPPASLSLKNSAHSPRALAINSRGGSSAMP